MLIARVNQGRQRLHRAQEGGCLPRPTSRAGRQESSHSRVVRAAHLIAAEVLGGVHRPIRRLHEVSTALRMGGIGRNTQGAGEMAAASHAEGLRGDRGPQAFGGAQGLSGCALRQDGYKLLSAPAPQHIDPAQHTLRHPRQLP